MAVPKNATLHRPAPLKSGVILGVSPSSDPTFDVEIARATSGVYETISRLTPKGSGIPVSYTDILPVTTGTFSYKARAVKEGYLAGDYTAIVEARPIQLPEFPPNITPLTGKGIGASLFISTGAPPTVGQKVATASVTKNLRVSPSEFTPVSSTITYGRGITSLSPKAPHTSTSVGFVAHAPMPVGATVDRIAVSYLRASTVMTFQVQLYSVTTGASATLQYSKTSTETDASILTLTSSSFSFTTVSNFAMVNVIMKSTFGDPALRYVDLRYQMPNYNVTV